MGIDILSCTKDELIIDPGSEVIGSYKGIKVETIWQDTIVGYRQDTVNIMMVLSISELDSIVDLRFSPSFTSTQFSFEYTYGQFISTAYYHPPKMEFRQDTLYFWYKKGLGPGWIECFTLKSK